MGRCQVYIDQYNLENNVEYDVKTEMVLIIPIRLQLRYKDLVRGLKYTYALGVCIRQGACVP